MKHTMLIAAIAAATALPACSTFTSKVNPEPSAITVTQALEDIAQGLAAFKDTTTADGTPLRTGMLLKSTKVVLKVTASAKDSSKLVLDISAKPTTHVASASAKGEFGGELNTGRENTIELEFLHPAYAPKDSAIATVPDVLKALLERTTADTFAPPLAPPR